MNIMNEYMVRHKINSPEYLKNGDFFKNPSKSHKNVFFSIIFTHSSYSLCMYLGIFITKEFIQHCPIRRLHSDYV